MKRIRYALFDRHKGVFVLTNRMGDLSAYLGISLGHMRRLLSGVQVLEYRGCRIERDVEVGKCRHEGRDLA